MIPVLAIAPARAARIAGAFYLITLASAMASDLLVKTPLVVPGNAVKTAENIAAAPGLYRFGIACDLVTAIGVIALAWALYVLLRPVSREIALLGVLLRLVEATLGFVAILHSAYALRLLGRASYLAAMDPAQLQVLAHFCTVMKGSVQTIMFLLLGLGSGVFSVLLLRSGHVPRVLATLGVFASLLLATYAFALLTQPAAATLGLLPVLPLTLYEIVLGCWLLFAASRISNEPVSLSP